MKYGITMKVDAPPKQVFAATHHYKKTRRPSELIGDSKLVKTDFRVLTRNTLGLGAVYSWKFSIFGVRILEFKERIVEWQEDRLVAYQAISGWKMLFRLELIPTREGTFLKIEIHLSPTGISFLDLLLRPVVQWGLTNSVKRLVRNIEAERK